MLKVLIIVKRENRKQMMFYIASVSSLFKDYNIGNDETLLSLLTKFHWYTISLKSTDKGTPVYLLRQTHCPKTPF